MRSVLLPLISLVILNNLGCGPEVDLFPGTDGGGGAGTGGTGGTGSAMCVPKVEICDGLDNDCDGQIDEGCGGCVTGATQTCYSGDPGTLGVGTCAGGTQTCDAQGSWGPCSGEVTPVPEACNGLDEDCNGQIDDGLGTQSCGVGACMVMVATCVNGMPQACVPGPASLEVCDAVDNDCDGATDESDPNLGMACMTGQPGICAAGKWQCNGGVLSCAPNQVAQAEACDGLDNDCDGQSDEGNPGGGNACMTGLPGACAAGTTQCSGGKLACVGNQPPQNEICDGIDNNCDGQIDTAPCGCGGLAVCMGGMLVCGGSAPVYFEETFTGNGVGWTLGPDWAIGPTMVSSGQQVGNPDPAFDYTPTADNRVAGVVLGGNAPQMQHPPYYLTSPIINTSAIAGPIYLDYQRWLNSDYTPWMQSTIEVYNGMSWVMIWQSGGAPGVQDKAWQHLSYDLTPHKNATMQVRFGYQIGAAGVFTVSSWNIDDVRITGAPCP